MSRKLHKILVPLGSYLRFPTLRYHKSLLTTAFAIRRSRLFTNIIIPDKASQFGSRQQYNIKNVPQEVKVEILPATALLGQQIIVSLLFTRDLGGAVLVQLSYYKSATYAPARVETSV